MKRKPDQPLEEIWAIRRQIARQFGYDPRKQVAYYQRKQRQSGAQIHRRTYTRVADNQTLVLRETPPGES